MFKLAMEVCFENYFGLIHAIFLLLGSTKSVYFVFGTPGSKYRVRSNQINKLKQKRQQFFISYIYSFEQRCHKCQ